MSLPDWLLDIPEMDAYCNEHARYFYEDDGCPECKVDAADTYADMHINDRLERRG